MEALIILAVLAAWGSGFAACRVFHRQRGIETDNWNIVLVPAPNNSAPNNWDYEYPATTRSYTGPTRPSDLVDA